MSRRPEVLITVKKMYRPSRDQLSRYGMSSVAATSSASAAPFARR